MHGPVFPPRARRSVRRVLAGIAVSLATLAAGGCLGRTGEGMEPVSAEIRPPSCRRVVTPEGAPSPVRVAWSRAADDLRVLDGWCASVGPAVVDPLPGPAGAVADSAAPVLDSLPVVTWNVHVGGGDVERLVAALREGRLTGGVPVRHFVLLLQETYRASDPLVPDLPPGWGGIPARITESPPGRPRADVVAEARRLGLSVFYVPSMRNGLPVPGEADEDRGNAILSTLPLGDLAAAELPFEAQRRVAVSSTVRGRGTDGRPWSLRATSAHLDVRSRWSRFWQSLGGGRKRQALGLANALQRDTATVRVIGGDFNTLLGRREEAVILLRRLYPQSPLPTPGPTFVRFGSHLDYLFARGALGRPRLKARRLGEPFGSDHFPLLMWVPVAARGPHLPAPARIAVPEGAE